MTITEMHHVTAGMLSQKPPLGPKVGRPPKSAVARAAERWFLRKKPPVCTTTASDKVFPGQYYDQETGLYQNGWRTYDPSIGRYITSDPVGIIAGLNTYTYVLQNPIIFVDPTGRISESEVLLGRFLILVHETGVTALGQGLAVSGSYLAGRYIIGPLLNQGISDLLTHINGTPTSLGTEWYEYLNPGSPTEILNHEQPDNSGVNNETYLFPGMGSPGVVGDETYKLFCDLNPNAPNCKYEIPNESDNCD